MFGLIVLLVIAGYIAVSVLVVKATMRWARRRGRSAVRWGWGAGLLMYLPVFWDFIPTVLLHRYLCATEQGFWVYKTVEQWQRENPGVAETLSWSKVPESFEAPEISDGLILNERFVWELRKRHPFSHLPVWISEQLIVDRATEEATGRSVAVSSGYGNFALGSGGSWKFWLQMPTCDSGTREFAEYLNQVQRQGETK
jgi:hypothetical protein